MLKRAPTIKRFPRVVKVNKAGLTAEVHRFTAFFYDPPGGFPPGPRGTAVGWPGKASGAGAGAAGGNSGRGSTSGIVAAGGGTTGPATTGGGVTAPMRRITIF